MKHLNLILTLCCLLAILAPVFAQESTTGSVRGSVRDTSPLQNAIAGV